MNQICGAAFKMSLFTISLFLVGCGPSPVPESVAAVVRKACLYGMNVKTPFVASTSLVAGSKDLDQWAAFSGPYFCVHAHDPNSCNKEQELMTSMGVQFTHYRKDCLVCRGIVPSEVRVDDPSKATSFLVIRRHDRGKIGTGWIRNGMIETRPKYDVYLTFVRVDTGATSPSIHIPDDIDIGGYGPRQSLEGYRVLELLNHLK